MTGSSLKIIAVIAMLMDHIALYVMARNPEWADCSINVMGFRFLVMDIMRIVGRMAFPIFAFLLVEGFLHTQNRFKYGIYLFLFALLSEYPFDLVNSGHSDMTMQNVFFTLCIGYMGMVSYTSFKNDKFNQSLSLLMLGGTAWIIRCDYGISGFLFIMAMFIMKEEKLLKVIIGSWLLPKGLFAAMAGIPILLYNGKRGFVKGYMKYAFYLFYPIHLLGIYLFDKYM